MHARGSALTRSPFRHYSDGLLGDHSKAMSGRMVNASTAPSSSKPREPRNGRCQLPVRSATYPNATGDRMAASAEPLFINPLAVPEYFPALSLGIDHLGPITISAEKKPSAAPKPKRV